MLTEAILRRVCRILLALVLSATPVRAQNAYQQFDVASVRENKSGAQDTTMSFPLNRDGYVHNGGSFRVTNFPLSGYLMFAYKLTLPQSAALGKRLPDWAKSARYDIEARVEGDPDKDDMRRMMRALLADRFALKVHAESHEVAVLEMVLARPGKPGPSLKPHPADDATCAAVAKPAGFFSPCGTVGFMPGAPVRAAGRNVSLQTIADSLSGNAGKPLVDRTGLTGTFDFTLEFVNDADARPDETGATMLQALGDQLGLKLVPGKGSAETYVLDHVERPSAN